MPHKKDSRLIWVKLDILADSMVPSLYLSFLLHESILCCHFQVNIKTITQILWLPPDQLGVGDSGSMSLVGLIYLHQNFNTAFYNQHFIKLTRKACANKIFPDQAAKPQV